MADIASLGFKVDTSGLVKGEKAMKSYAQTGERAEAKTKKSANNMSESFVKLAASIGLVTAAMAGFSKLVAVAREFDILNAQLVTATGSAFKAAQAFKSIQDFAARTPFDLAQVTESFVKLKNLGLDPSERALTSYGNTASAMGRSMNQLIEAVADATTNEFERLKEFGIKAKQEGENVSFTFRGMTTTVKKEANAIQGFLIALGENEFAGAMQERVKTLDGAISNLGDSWDKLFLNISQNGFGGAIESDVRSATELIDLVGENLGAAGDAVKAMTAVVAIGLTPAMLAYVSSLSATATAQLLAGTTAIKTSNALGVVTIQAASATVATNALGIATKFLLGPWGLLLTAIGAGVGVFAASAVSASDLAKELDAVNKATKQAIAVGGDFRFLLDARASQIKNMPEAALRREIKKTAGQVEKMTNILKGLNSQDKASAAFRRSTIGSLAINTKMYELLTGALKSMTTEQFKASKAFADLVDKLDPAAKALKDYKNNQKLLAEEGEKLGLSTLEMIRLNALLDESFTKAGESANKLEKSLANQIDALEQERLQLTMTSNAYEIYAARMEAITNGASPAEIAAIESRIRALQKLRKEQEKKPKGVPEDPEKDLKNLIKSVEEFGGAWTKSGSMIVDAFGDISDAVTDYMDRLDGIKDLQADLDI